MSTEIRARRRPTAWRAGIAGLLLAALTACAPDPEGARPNVILISVDTLRADHLSVYGYHRPTSPHLEALAADAVLFENFINNGGGTLPSHLTMMTSLHPAAHGITPSNGRSLGPEHQTLAEHLRSTGYASAAFTDSGWMKGRFGFAQGFDLFDDGGGRFEAILPKAVDWLRRNRDRRFFLFLHTYDVHSEWRRLPYECPGDYHELYTGSFDVEFDGCRDGECASRRLALWNQDIAAGKIAAEDLLSAQEIAFMMALYDGCINYVDAQLGRLVDELRALGLYDSALLVVTSDHGEEFAEHGQFLHAKGGYEELARIPLLMKLPHSRAGGLRVPHLAALVDLMPTILEIVGLPANERVQGKSLLPAVHNDAGVRQATYFKEGARTRSWKYIVHPRRELYDLEADPAERVDLLAREPQRAEQLERYLREQLERDRRLLREAESAHEIELTEQEVRELKALGYLE